MSGADLHTAGTIAHHMVGSAGTLGANLLAQACRDLETAARTGKPDSLADLLERVEATYLEASTLLVQERRRNSANGDPD